MAKSGVKKSRGGKLTRAAQGTVSVPPVNPNAIPLTAATATVQSQAPQPAPAQQPQPTPTPQQQTAPATQTPDFSSMTDAQFAAMVNNLSSVDMPNFLKRNDSFQQFVYANNINGKPVQEDAKTFAANSQGKVKLWRTVNQTYDARTDVGMNADQIAQQFIDGRLSRPGNGVYGQGYYFADSRRASTAYGSTTGNAKKTAVLSAYINNNAKIVNYGTIDRQMRRELMSGSALGNALRGVGNMDEALSIYAMRKGYNVINCGTSTGYYVILDRSAVTVNTTVSAK